MIVHPSTLDGVKVIKNKKFVDQRGCFVKTFNSELFAEHGLCTSFRENFYSISQKGVIRGMHFQLPPFDHAKLVYVTHGEILDVVVDIRNNSASFGNYYSTTLSSKNDQSLYIGKGYAHGFLTISETATVIYLTETVHNSQYDTGIKWDSFGFSWGIDHPVVSDRDSKFATLTQFKDV